MPHKPRLLTGDTPTGKLHLGHWVGSLENRVAMQADYDCFFILANLHAFTTRADRSQEIRQNVMDIILDYLSVGIDPKQSSIFLQSDVPAIAELTVIFSMLVRENYTKNNPTIKAEIRDKGLSDSNLLMGFLLYPVGQAADILSFCPDIVPVGEDQLPHVEKTWDIARKFNQMYCGVDSHIDDEQYVDAGGLFPIPKVKLGRVKRLVGIGKPDADGNLLKMSKSLGNAILLSDTPDEIRKKIRGMYTDPNRVRVTDPGKVEGNPLWALSDAFIKDTNWLEEKKEAYRLGQVGDKECKEKLTDAIIALTDPMRARRAEYEGNDDLIIDVLRQGTARANAVAEQTLAKAKKYIGQSFMTRDLKIHLTDEEHHFLRRLWKRLRHVWG